VSSGLRQRVVTALLLAVALLAILAFTPPPVAVTIVFAGVVLGAWEWAGFAHLHSVRGRAGYAGLVLVLVSLAWWVTEQPTALVALLALAASWWLAAFWWVVNSPERGGGRAAALAGLAVLVPAAVGIGRLLLLEPRGQELFLFLIVLIAAADVGAYFGGRALGRRKLAPRVSPNKTWEGLLCGMGAALLAALAGAWLFQEPVGRWVLVCLAVALFSVVGDLAESMFKRQVGLKDSSALLPGHGGVLDRIDSLTAAGPVFLLGLIAFGVPT